MRRCARPVVQLAVLRLLSDFVFLISLLHYFRTRLVGDSERNVGTGCNSRNTFNVSKLVIEEDVRFELLHDSTLLDPAEKEHFVDFNAPVSESSHYPLVGRSVPCRYDRCPKLRGVIGFGRLALALKTLKTSHFVKEASEWTFLQRFLGKLRFLTLERFQAILLEDGFGRVICDDAVEIERNS